MLTDTVAGVAVLPPAAINDLGVVTAVAFDLDDTLAESKSPISPAMARHLVDLCELMPVCIISGGTFGQFQQQVLDQLPSAPTALNNLHLMPTCGTRYYTYRNGTAVLEYVEELPADDRSQAAAVLEQTAKELGLWAPDDEVFGERIEDRGSQVTYSALGQQAPVDRKKLWDPRGLRRAALQALVQFRLPHLEVRAGGSTSIDITRRGIDKAFGMRAFAQHCGLKLEQILFLGDRLEPEGNDFPVIALGVQTHAVADHVETEALLPDLLDHLGRQQRR